MLDEPADEGGGEYFFGTHAFRWEAPDIGHLVYSGSVDGPMVASFARQSRPFLLKKPRMFMLVDVTKLTRINAEGRKLSAKASEGLSLRGVAIVGASPAIRVMAGLVSRAVEILSGNRDNPTRFFETERDARAWIAVRREQVRERTRQDPHASRMA